MQLLLGEDKKDGTHQFGLYIYYTVIQMDAVYFKEVLWFCFFPTYFMVEKWKKKSIWSYKGTPFQIWIALFFNLLLRTIHLQQGHISWVKNWKDF